MPHIPWSRSAAVFVVAVTSPAAQDAVLQAMASEQQSGGLNVPQTCSLGLRVFPR
jgi:hypothetical protein